MRRHILALTLTVFASVALTGSALAQAAPTIRATPDVGNQAQDFTFRGDGFPVGSRLEIFFTDPTSTTFTLSLNGKPAVLQVDPSGVFEFQILPMVDLKGAQAGVWIDRMCIEGTQTCWEGKFTINA